MREWIFFLNAEISEELILSASVSVLEAFLKDALYWETITGNSNYMTKSFTLVLVMDSKIKAYKVGLCKSTC
jgi:hypothetical protein